MWNLMLNEDETMIADSVNAYLARELPIERLRPKSPPRDLAQIRADMVEHGWFGVGLPESVGGSGLGLVEELLVQRECGRFLVSPAVPATVLAAHVAYHAGDTDLAARMVAGKCSAAFALLSAPDPGADPVPAYAFDWNPGDFLLFWNAEGMGLCDAMSFEQASLDECLDDSVTLHAGSLSLRRPRHWVTSKQSPLALHAQVLLAANLVGLAWHASELTVGYTKTREQFGKPIGSFQAVKHRCADMAVRARLSWYQTELACLKVQTGAHDAVLQAAAAKLLAAQAAHENGRYAVHLHGGLGFQSECDAHWFMKRAHLYDQVGGNMRTQVCSVIAEPSPLVHD
jgi:alkylation response protein AidB-like acyl-CoA dehydrogenase